MGEFIGPLIGNLLYTQLGYQNTISVSYTQLGYQNTIYCVSGAIFLFSIIYFLSTIEKSTQRMVIGKGGKLIPANRI